MSDFIFVDGDTVTFLPSFGTAPDIATVTVAPGNLAGSGPAKIGGKPACVDGDETKVKVGSCAYITATYSVSGLGTFVIDALANNQKAQKTNTGGKAVLLKGSKFAAKFQVDTANPAKMPPSAGGTKDPMDICPGGSHG